MKRYRDLNTYLKERYGERVQKISLDAGLGCPNRDGTLSRDGCLYCNSRGSGTGAMSRDGRSIEDQLRDGVRFARRRYGAKKYIAYFQSFTNTYAPIDQLNLLYGQALAYPGVVGLSVGTRPDCFDNAVAELLWGYQKDHLVWVEFGLQSAHDQTLKKINRGHDVACFQRSVELAHERGLNICVHVILGLPGETPEMMLDTARFLSMLPIHGVKIHLLYVLKGTGMALLYKKGEYHCLSQDEYVDRVVDFLEVLPPNMIIHRLTGDPPLAELVDPQWAREKSKTLNKIHKRMEERDTWQGKKVPRSLSQN